MQKEEQKKLVVALMAKSLCVGLALGFAIGVLFALGREIDQGTILNHGGQSALIAVAALLIGFILALRLDRDHTEFTERSW